MRRSYRKYSRKFKLEAIRMAEVSEKTYAEIERELGITRGLLGKWATKYSTEGEQAFPGKGNLKPEEALIRELERENVRLRQEREILKKVLSIFSREVR